MERRHRTKTQCQIAKAKVDAAATKNIPDSARWQMQHKAYDTGKRMNQEETEERLKYMLKHCDPDGYCKYFMQDRGCDGCCNAVRSAINALRYETLNRAKAGE